MFSISETYNNSKDAIMFWKASRQKKKSCFVRNNAQRAVGMGLITAHMTEQLRLNLHNGNTQTTGLASIDTTSKLTLRLPD